MRGGQGRPRPAFLRPAHGVYGSMSAIPPNVAGSVLQAPLAQQQAADVRRVADDSRENASQSQVRSVEQQDTTVSAGDEDVRVGPDAGGTGGQGRSFREEPGAAPEKPDDADEGITVDESGQMHLDLEA